MNEHIEELIVAYLHRGSTPEQEHELFEACRVQPEVSNLLREHLILSLKLRQLRDRTVVPASLQNEVISSINALPSLANEESPALTPAMEPAPRFRFGWGHLAWSSLAGAAILAFAFLASGVLSPKTEQQMITRVQAVHDTTRVAQIDTVLRTRVVKTPVYITQRAAGQESQPEISQTPSQKNGVTSETVVPAQETATRETVQQNENARNATDQNTPAFTEGKTKDTQPSYLQQYSAMVVSLEKVRLTSDDRIRN